MSSGMFYGPGIARGISGPTREVKRGFAMPSPDWLLTSGRRCQWSSASDGLFSLGYLIQFSLTSAVNIRLVDNGQKNLYTIVQHISV